jgi:V/A-type H+/Na+-transporting ATPase subunit E
MDEKLGSLIEKIKREGIEEAERLAAEIAAKANQEAASILEQARREATVIVEDSRSEAGKLQENAERAVQQSARDVKLLLKEQISALFDRVFKKEVGTTLTPDFLQRMILMLVTEWVKEGQVEVSVSAADKEKLEGLLLSSLKEDLKGSVNLRVSGTVSKGFRIELKDESVYYDFTDDTIADALKTLINPGLQAILDKE